MGPKQKKLTLFYCPCLCWRNPSSQIMSVKILLLRTVLRVQVYPSVVPVSPPSSSVPFRTVFGNNTKSRLFRLRPVPFVKSWPTKLFKVTRGPTFLVGINGQWTGTPHSIPSPYHRVRHFRVISSIDRHTRDLTDKMYTFTSVLSVNDRDP